jgi:hypothetical protein
MRREQAGPAPPLCSVVDCPRRTFGVVHGIARDRLQADLGGAELRESELGRLTWPLCDKHCRQQWAAHMAKQRSTGT